MSSDNQASDQETTGSETDVATTSEPTLVTSRRWLGWLDAAGLIVNIFFLISTGVGGIAATLSGHANSWSGTGNANIILLLAFTMACTVGLIWYVGFGASSADPILRHLITLMFAVGINIYVAISVWTVIVNYIHPAGSPKQAGLMVWWNISDAIPFINVNSVLDWRQPLTGYPVRVGWLFLVQRAIVILTLIRVIQLLFYRWAHSSKAEETELEHAEPPTDHSGTSEDIGPPRTAPAEP